MPSESAALGSAEFQMSLLLFVALAGYLIAYAINQSAAVGIILMGIVVGPSIPGLIHRFCFESRTSRSRCTALYDKPGVCAKRDSQG